MVMIGRFLFGSKPRMKKQSLLQPGQQEGLNQILQNPLASNPLYQKGSSYLQNLLGGGNEAYQQFEQPLLDQFQEQIIPQIAERFAGMGTGSGALSSSGLNQSLAQGMKGLGSILGQQRANLTAGSLGQASQYAQQPVNNLLNALGIRSFQPYRESPQQGFLAPLLGGALGGLTGGLGTGAGLAFGNQLGQNFFGQQSPQAGSPGGFGQQSPLAGAFSPQGLNYGGRF